jgi:hypothetical protein
MDDEQIGVSRLASVLMFKMSHLISHLSAILIVTMSVAATQGDERIPLRFDRPIPPAAEPQLPQLEAELLAVEPGGVVVTVAETDITRESILRMALLMRWNNPTYSREEAFDIALVTAVVETAKLVEAKKRGMYVDPSTAAAVRDEQRKRCMESVECRGIAEALMESTGMTEDEYFSVARYQDAAMVNQLGNQVRAEFEVNTTDEQQLVLRMVTWGKQLLKDFPITWHDHEVEGRFGKALETYENMMKSVIGPPVEAMAAPQP